MKGEIRSRANPRLKEVFKIVKNVAQSNYFVVEGHKLIQEALRSGLAPESLWCDSSQPEPQAVGLPSQIYQQVSPTKSGNSPLAVIQKPAFQTELNARPVLVLYQVQDPGNAGAMIRAALAFGIQQFLFVKPCVYPLHHTLIRASAGALFHGSILHLDHLPDFEEHALVLADGSSNVEVHDFEWPDPIALAMGNEGHGFPEKVLKNAHAVVRIAHAPAVESLNVMGALHVLLYDRMVKSRV